MTWQRLQPEKAPARIPAVRVALLMSKRGVCKLSIFLNMKMVERLGWEAGDRFHAAIGSAENAGWLLLERDKDGGFAIAMLKYGARINLPDVPGSPEGALPSQVCECDLPDGPDDTLPIKLPWHVDGAARNNDSELSEIGDLPPIKLDGRVAYIGKDIVRDLPPTLQNILTALADARGRIVRKQTLHDALYGADPNGGPEMKVLDVHIHKLRAKIKETTIEIETDTATGWRLVRRSA